MKPNQSGYYQTLVKPPKGKVCYRPVYWNNSKENWEYNSIDLVPDVLRFYTETRADTYTECFNKAQDMRKQAYIGSVEDVVDEHG
jgi:hypothetical protein